MFLVGLSLLCGPPLAAQTPSPDTSAPSAMHDVVDGYGRSVRIPVNPARIVSLAPSLTETLYALGVEDRLVGDTDYCDYPADAQKKPKVGGVMNPSLEKIVALHPDLVLVTKEGNKLDTVRSLDTLGIPSYATDAHTVDQIISSTLKLADVLNVPESGKALADGLKQRLVTLQSKLTGVPATGVLFIVWAEPLISIGKGTFVADALRRADAVSIIDSSQDWPQVSLEEVARLQPEYLVFSESHSDLGAREFDGLAIRPGWRILNAVQNRHFVVVSDAIIRPAPRIVSVIEDLAHRLHPEVFQAPPGSEKSMSPSASGASVHSQSKSNDLPSMLSSCSLESSCAR